MGSERPQKEEGNLRGVGGTERGCRNPKKGLEEP